MELEVLLSAGINIGHQHIPFYFRFQIETAKTSVGFMFVIQIMHLHGFKNDEK